MLLSRPREMGSVCDDKEVVFRQQISIEISGVDEEEEKELHVLAVDDSLVDRMVVEKLLRTSSFRVTVAESGNRALQYLGLLNGDESSSGLKVNLVLTDYSMPGMNGYELMKKIKESTAFREFPVVIMSSENILPRIDRCLEEGAVDYIIKPVKLSDVKRLKDFMIKGPDHNYPSAAKEESNKDLSNNRTVPIEYSAVNVQSSLLSPPADSPPSIQSKLLSSTSSEQRPPHSPRCSRRRPRQQRHRRC